MFYNEPNDEIVDLAEAVRQMKENKEEGFSTIYFNTYKYVYNRAKYMLKDEQEAQDLTQDVYMALYKGIGDLKNENALYGWLKTIVFRQGLRFIEKKQQNTVLSEDAEFVFDILPDDGVKIEESYGKSEDIETVKQCIGMLSDEQRIVVLAYYYDNMSVKEIAKTLEISEGTVKSRLYLARKRLMESLKAEEEKQGYKFFAAGMPLIGPALDSVMKSDISVANEVLMAGYKNITAQVGIVKTAATVKSTSVFSRVVETFVNMGAKKVALMAAGVAVACGTAGGIIALNVNDPVENTVANESTVTVEKTKEVKETESTEEITEGSSEKASNTNVGTVSGVSYEYISSDEDIKLTWNAVDGADGYEVYVATSEVGRYSKEETVTTTSCTIWSKAAYYHFKVRAYKMQGDEKIYGSFSSEISTEPAMTVPQSITITSAQQKNNGDIYVTVKPFTVNCYSEIKLYCATSKSGSYDIVDMIDCEPGQSITVKSFTDGSTHDNNQTYYYKIRVTAFSTWCTKPDLNSNYSNIVSCTYIEDSE